MKKSKKTAIAALVLGIFFLFQSGAEIFFALGKDRDPAKGLKNLRLSMKLFPLAGVYFNEAGFALLQAGTTNRDDAAVKRSIPYFKAALKRNLLDYQSRYYLAKAYLQMSPTNGDYFDMAVTELKRAALVRGNNKLIALDCSRVFFSIWPLLEPGDQAFAARLLANAMPALSWAEFSPLLEMWSLYVQDAALLMELLPKKPGFFAPAANQLLASGIALAERRELLNLHEIYAIDLLERRLNELGLQGTMNLDKAKSLLSQSRQIKGYYRLQPGSKFDAEKFAGIRRQLLLEVISGLLRDPKARTDPRSAKQLRDDIQTYIADHSELNSLDELQKLLAENDYFKDNDFSSLYLKTLIAFKKGNYGDVISAIEALRGSISYVKKEQSVDYTDILLLLVDSYYDSKLLTAAESVARELYENQPDNPDIWYRILRIRNILGVEGAPDPDLDAKLETVMNSRILNVVSAKGLYDVYLFNQPEIEITFDPAFIARLKPKQLVQVFVDGKIAFESYVDGLPEKIVIGQPFVGIESKVKVQVTII